MAQIELTEEQNAIKDRVTLTQFDDDYKDVQVIKGYAGTGKTVTTSEIINSLASTTSPVVVLAPTAAALSVIANKLAGVGNNPAVSVKTIASMTRTPTPVVKLGENLPTFSMNREGLEGLSKFVSRLRIDVSGIATVTNNFSHSTRPLDLTSAGAIASIKFNKDTVSIDEKKLTQQLRTRMGDKVDVSVDTEHLLNTVDDCASRLFRTNPSTVVVDEFSMVSAADADLIVEACVRNSVRIIVCGDPGQLEPVEGAKNDYIRAKSDFEKEFPDAPSRPAINVEVGVNELTRVLRSEDSVASLAADIRSGRRVSALAGENDNVVTVSVKSVPKLIEQHEDLMLNAGAVVTFTNKNVRAFNEGLRMLHGIIGPVQAGDRLVCNKNTYDTFAHYFYNGEILKVIDTGLDIRGVDKSITTLRERASAGGNEAQAILDLIERDEIVGALVESKDGGKKACFVFSPDSRVPHHKKRLYEKLMNSMDVSCAPIIDVSFAYALTVHKAQGSEWDTVVYFTTQRELDMLKTSNMPYTAVTRAKSNVTILYYPK